MTEQQAQLVDAVGKVGIGTICAVALGLAFWLQYVSVSKQQDIQTEFYQKLIATMEEDTHNQQVMRGSLVEILKEIKEVADR